MRRVAVVVFLSASLAVLPLAVAQRGGQTGGFGGGHPAGSRMAGGTMGRMGGGFGSGSYVHPPGFAGRNFVTAPNFVSTSPNFVSTAPAHAFVPLNHVPYPVSIAPNAGWRDQGRGSHDRDRGRDGDHDRDRHRSYYGGYGYGGYPYAYASSWTLLPWDLGTSDSTGYADNSGSEADQQQPAISEAPPSDGYRPEYSGSPEPTAEYAPPRAVEEQPPASVAAEPALTLIFSDGHREDIHNYVLTSDAVIVLDEAASGRQKRIPLSSLDLSATQQAAQQQGLDFTPPA
jgi:hypothetical protein